MEWFILILVLFLFIAIWRAINNHKEILRLEVDIKEYNQLLEKDIDYQERLKEKLQFLEASLKKYTSSYLYIHFNDKKE